MISDDFPAYLARLNDDLDGPFTMSKQAIINGVIGGLILWVLIGAAFAAVLGRMG